MNVRDVMTQPAQTCPATMSLESAAKRMGQTGCGSLLVTDGSGRLTGIITDRDIAVAIGELDPEVHTVGDVMSCRPFVCRPDDPLDAALTAMGHHKVRRLPVVDGDGEILGVLSIVDIILWGTSGGAVSAEHLLATLRCLFSAERAGLVEAVDG